MKKRDSLVVTAQSSADHTVRFADHTSGVKLTSDGDVKDGPAHDDRQHFDHCECRVFSIFFPDVPGDYFGRSRQEVPKMVRFGAEPCLPSTRTVCGSPQPRFMAELVAAAIQVHCRLRLALRGIGERRVSAAAVTGCCHKNKT